MEYSNNNPGARDAALEMSRCAENMTVVPIVSRERNLQSNRDDVEDESPMVKPSRGGFRGRNVSAYDLTTAHKTGRRNTAWRRSVVQR
eukprot:1096574-Prymnesium_polylepis.1